MNHLFLGDPILGRCLEHFDKPIVGLKALVSFHRAPICSLLFVSVLLPCNQLDTYNPMRVGFLHFDSKKIPVYINQAVTDRPHRCDDSLIQSLPVEHFQRGAYYGLILDVLL